MRRVEPARLIARLEQWGLDITPVLAEEPGHALAAAEQRLANTAASYQRLIVAGGDGTINSLLPALQKTSIPLALLPVGSVNVLARELGIPRSLREAARIAAHGIARRIDLGRFQSGSFQPRRAQGRPFVLMAGLGFDGAVVQAVRSSLKKRVGVLAYLLNGLRLLWAYPRRRFQINADDQSLEAEAWQVVIANAASYTYRWSLAPQAKIDDGRLEVCILQGMEGLPRLKQMASILLGKPEWAPVTHLSGRRIEIRADSPVPVQMDGDFALSTETAQIEVAPGALTVMTGEGR